MDEIPTQRVAADGSEMATVCLPSPPLEFNRYELLRELGRGGTGVVWMAHDRVLGAPVALKTLRPEITSEASALKELKSEVLINRTLSHPHIVRTYDFVTNDRSSAISMEFVNGTNLHRLKTERPRGFFEAEEIAHWVYQLCDAMEYAHRRNVVHRDLKPANLMIDEQGQLKVGDFGIGQTATDTVRGVTRKSSGTPPFMSPQQTMGERAVTADDIYGIGATIYDLLTGDPPFFRGAIREQALAKVAPPMGERRKELGRAGRPIPSHWEAAVAAALSKEAGGRPASAAAFRAMLELPAGSPAPAVTLLRPEKKSSHRWVWLSAAALCGAAATTAIAWKMGYLRAVLPSVRAAAPAPRDQRHKKIRSQPGGAGLAGSRASNASGARDAPAAINAPMFASARVNGTSRGALDSSSPASPGREDNALGPGAGRPERATAGNADIRYHNSPPNADGGDGHLRPSGAAGTEPVETLVRSGAVSADEGALIRRALIGQLTDYEQALATRLAVRHSLTPTEWRTFSGLAPAATPTVEKLRPLLMSGAIREAEFPYLAAALAGRKGADEQTLASRFVERRELTPGQWRSQTALYPPPPVDPVVAKLKPWLASNRLSSAEASWIEAALRGEKSPAEKSLAGNLIDRHALTPYQWRARTALEYPLTAVLPDSPSSPAKWPPAIDLPLNAQITLRLLRVDPGAYRRGTPASEHGRRNNEPLPSSVRIESPFYLAVTETTQAEYLAVMPRNPSYWRGHANWPIDQVDWQSLTGPNGFLERLNRRLGSMAHGALTADLPTGDEWEYAARAGTEGPYYASGLETLANFNQTDNGSPQAVGSYTPNAWGFYDMLGNVAEWCRDRFIRGGSWQSNAAGCRVGWRTQSNPDSDSDPSSTQGFRLLLRAPGGE